MNSTSGIGGTSSGADSGAQTPAKTTSLGADAFMTLLVTQLQHQDPTKPQDETQFVTQLAQFSSLQELQKMNASLSTIATFYTAIETEGKG